MTLDPKVILSQRLDSTDQGIPAVLLVGGLGTRLQAVVSGTPKPLARVGDAPFLELLVRQLQSQGIRRLVMCTGHLAEQVEEMFGNGHTLDVSIVYSKETSPLKTAGAVKLAEGHLAQASEFLVLNGDSFLEVNFTELIRFHRKHGGLVSMAVRRVPDAARYGTVQLDSQSRVIGFSEKLGVSVPGIINAGVYVFSHSVLQHIPEGPSSLERDVFPLLLGHGLYALEQQGMFIDIGTPEDYARAQTLCQSLYQAALPQS